MTCQRLKLARGLNNHVVPLGSNWLIKPRARTCFNEILFEITIFGSRKCNYKCPDLNVLKYVFVCFRLLLTEEAKCNIARTFFSWDMYNEHLFGNKIKRWWCIYWSDNRQSVILQAYSLVTICIMNICLEIRWIENNACTRVAKCYVYVCMCVCVCLSLCLCVWCTTMCCMLKFYVFLCTLSEMTNKTCTINQYYKYIFS